MLSHSIHDGPDASDEAVALRVIGSGKPLFLLPAVCGEVFSCAELAAHVDPEAGVYALPGPHRSRTPFRTFQAAARHYAGMIRHVQPSGPYRLAGGSLGGLMAYEVATQLIGENEHVEYLALFDTRLPDSATFDPQPVHDYVAQHIPARLHLFAAEQTVKATGDPESLLGWDTLLPRAQIDRTVVAGAPFIASLGAAVSQSLRRAARQPVPHAARNRSLYTIQAGGDAPAPIFCVPGAGDSITAFAPLARELDPRWPLHGFQPRGLADKQVPHASVEAAAACYVQELADRCPSGRCHLIGHSFGGWVVFEMAAQLRAAGREPLSVTMIDTLAPVSQAREVTRIEAMLKLVELFDLHADRSLDIRAEDLHRLSPGAQLALLHERLTCTGLLSRRASPETVAAIFRSFSTNLRTSYRPRAACRQPVHLALASQAADPASSAAEQWREWAPHLRPHRVEGNHVTLLQAPNVAHLARWLESVIGTHA